jgi:endonuclease/exonuclease/phosphatase family metal-dependent hydrolase
MHSFVNGRPAWSGVVVLLAVGRPSRRGSRRMLARVESSVDRLRVLTLNLWGRSGAWEERRSVLVEGLRELRPDLIGFQEPIKHDDYDQVVDLLGPGFHIAYQTVPAHGESDHIGTAIASRWPLRAVRELDLHITPRTVDFPCATLAAEVIVPEPIGSLLFVNHLPSWQRDFEHERELQTVAAARFIEEIVGARPMHVVLVGDLDAVPEAASIRFWTGRQALGGMSVCYEDAWEMTHPEPGGETMSPDNPLRGGAGASWEPGRRIDYILIRRPGGSMPFLAIIASQLAFDEPRDGVWASDHFGVLADLAITR